MTAISRIFQEKGFLFILSTSRDLLSNSRANWSEPRLAGTYNGFTPAFRPHDAEYYTPNMQGDPGISAGALSSAVLATCRRIIKKHLKGLDRQAAARKS
jgi:hypothetical protein